MNTKSDDENEILTLKCSECGKNVKYLKIQCGLLLKHGIVQPICIDCACKNTN